MVEHQRRSPSRIFKPRNFLVLGGVLLVAAFVLWIYPSDEYIFLPDPAHPVALLVVVPGAHPTTDGGGIYYVDVVERKATLLEKLFGGLHDGADLVSQSDVLPPGVSDAQGHQLGLREMKQSQQIAAAVAFRAAGRKVTATATGALVTNVIRGMPAVGKLQPTDVIVAIDGKRVRSPADVRAVMGARHPGDKVRLTIDRGGTTKVIALKTVSSGHGSKRAVVGAFLDQAVHVKLPAGVSIDAGEVGGPSAGLAFALDILEKLGRDVDGGRRIAATGEIFLDGTVGPIGGIKQKTIGARKAGVDAFLVPAGENYRDASKYAHGLRIIPVKSFQQALRALATLPANS